MKIMRDESGQAMLFSLLCMTCLLGFVGLATDVGTLFHVKREMQAAADAAAIAGAAELNYGDMQTAADDAAAQNGVTNGSNGAVVTVHDPPDYGNYAGVSGYVEAIVSQPQSTIFMGFFGKSPMMVSARAVAVNGSGNGCIYTLGTSGADIDVTGNATISVPTCGITDDSSSSDALDLTGNITLTAQSIGVVGGASETGNISVTPTAVPGIVPVSNPLAYLTPPTYTSCSTPTLPTGNNTATLGPATPGGTVCYNGITLTGNQTLNLKPGVYVLNGDLDLTGNVSVSGTGVTLYLLDNGTITGNAALDLVAPTTGAYAGILLYEAPSDTDALTITGNSGSTLEGVIYAPNGSVTFTGNSSSTLYTDFVAQSLTLTGNSSFQSYAALPGGASPITATRLVE